MAENRNKTKNFSLLSTVAFVISLIAATALCFYVKAFDTTMTTRYFDVSVGVIGTDELAARNGFSLPDELQLVIEVSLKGRRSDLNSMKASDITAFVDVSGVSYAGYNNLPVSVNLPNGIELAKPIASVNLFLDTYQVKTVPVKASHTITSFASGIFAGAEQCNPSIITVSGPTSVLANISYASVVYSVAELNGSVVAHCAPELFFDDGTVVSNPYVSTDTSDIVVHLEAYRQKELPVVAKLVSDGTIISLGSVTVRGDVDTVNDMDQIVIGVDDSAFENAAIKDYFIPSILPDGVQLTADSVSLFELAKRTIEISPSSIKFTVDNIYAQNGIRVTVYGKTDDVALLNEGSFNATVNAAKLYSDDAGNLFGDATVTCTAGNIAFYYKATVGCTVTPSA